MGLIDALWNRLLGNPFHTGPVKRPPEILAPDPATRRQGAAGVAQPGQGTGEGHGSPARGGGGKAGAALVPAPGPTGRDAAATPRRDAMAQMAAMRDQVITPDRQALIREAMAVHQAKRKILDSLSDEDRSKLMLLAMRTLLKDEDDSGSGSGGSGRS